MKLKCKVAAPGVVARYAQVKLDGHWVRVSRGGVDIKVETSHPTDITDQLPEHIYAALWENLPRHSVALGELWVPDKPASCVKTALKGKWPELQITFFALEQMAPSSTRHIEIMPLEEVRQWFDHYKLNFAPFEVIDAVPVELGEGQLEHYRARARSMGIEGWVLKTGNLTGWHKLKCENSIDVVVTGVKDAKDGKYLGQVGSLLVSVTGDGGLNWNEIAAVSGMTDRERLNITEKYDELASSIIGKVCEIEYQRMDAQGRLRHPRFKRWRDDKPAKECGVDQDPDLERRYARGMRFVETEPIKFMQITPGAEHDAGHQ